MLDMAVNCEMFNDATVIMEDSATTSNDILMAVAIDPCL